MPTQRITKVAEGGLNMNTCVAGDVLYCSSTGVWSRLPKGVDGQVFQLSSGFPIWAAAPAGANPYTNIQGYTTINESFLGGSPAFSNNWASANFNSGGTSGAGSLFAGHPGTAQVSTGTSATNAGALYRLGIFYTVFTGGEILIDWVANINALSNGTDTFVAEFGFGTPSAANTVITDGVWWRYTHTENSGNWTTNCKASSVLTQANTSTAVDTNWHYYRIVVNANATSVGFFIDGVQVANSPITSNIPGASVGMSPFFRILKSAGTAARILTMDSFYFQQTL